MKNALTQREQKFYHAAFKTTEIEKIHCENGIKLLQFSDVHCKITDEVNEMHKQWCDEITFAYSGKSEIIHNGLRFPIKSGQLHLCFKGDLHQVIPSKTSPLRFYCIGFRLDEDNPLYALLRKVKEKIETTHSSVLDGCSDLLTAFEMAFRALNEQEYNDIAVATAVNSLNYIIASICNRFLEKNESTSNITEKESLLFYMVSFLKNNVYKMDALKLLSQDTGYSYSYLSHLFSNTMGQSLKRFFSSLRMSVATELLQKKSVTEVSELLGYSSIHSFTRAYKEFCGETPVSVKEKLSENSVTKYL